MYSYLVWVSLDYNHFWYVTPVLMSGQCSSEIHHCLDNIHTFVLVDPLCHSAQRVFDSTRGGAGCGRREEERGGVLHGKVIRKLTGSNRIHLVNPSLNNANFRIRKLLNVEVCIMKERRFSDGFVFHPSDKH
ncbi:hypothetical protein E2C01_030974 [Portunus trituberculatus]|uniref:Uncharacterized protein n=1 Tax=Portunus trituberculatus TaxID=210409 RepID=A0A5B7EXB2_PORTR|nr:hypothetical protein [Portunus trituberculatus]